MRFPDVNTEKFDLLVILFVEFVETHGPLDIWWSGVTPKYQSHGFNTPKLGKRNRISPTGVGEGEIRGPITCPGSLAIQFLLDWHGPFAVLDHVFRIIEQFCEDIHFLLLPMYIVSGMQAFLNTEIAASAIFANPFVGITFNKRQVLDKRKYCCQPDAGSVCPGDLRFTAIRIVTDTFCTPNHFVDSSQQVFANIPALSYSGHGAPIIKCHQRDDPGLARYQAEGQLRHENQMHALTALLGPLIYVDMLHRATGDDVIPPLNLELHVDHFLNGRCLL